MDKNRIRDGYYCDAEGNPVTLEELCRIEPAWAASRILVLLTELVALKEEIERLRGKVYCSDCGDELNRTDVWCDRCVDAYASNDLAELKQAVAREKERKKSEG